MDQHKTLGAFLNAVLQDRKLTGQALAQGANISQSAVSNLLQHGIDTRVRAPEMRILIAVADFLKIDVLLLYRLAGYVPPANFHYPSTSAFAVYLGQMYDLLPENRQQVLRGIVEALVAEPREAAFAPIIREHTHALLFAGIQDIQPNFVNEAANYVLAHQGFLHPLDVKLADHDEVAPGLPFGELDGIAQRRIIALINQKLRLNYTPDIVDPADRRETK